MATIIKIKALVAILAFGAIFATAGLASADNGLTVVSSSASSSIQFSIKYNYIGTWDMSNAPLKQKHGNPQCFWASGHWTNSVKTPTIKAYGETSRAKFCWLKHPVTINGVRYTAVKVAGGDTNSPCFNFAIPPGHHQPKPQIKGPVLDVNSTSNVEFNIPIHAHADAIVGAQKVCSDSVLLGGASGSAAVNGKFKVRISEDLLLRSHGRVDAYVRESIRQQLKVMVEGQATANATANVHLECGVTPTPTPSPTPSPSPTPTPTPKPPTLTVSCLTNHDVFSGGQIDLEIKAVYSNGTQPTLSPADVQIWADEGSMMDGTKHTYTDSSGTYWVQRWQGPITTITHTVKWHAMVKGATNTCDGVNNVVADSGW
jgi:hypothetical protein